MNPTTKIDNALNIIDKAYNKYKNPCFSSSFSNESLVLIDLIVKHFPYIEIFTIDTGRLHEETYKVMRKTQERYGIVYKTYYPDSEALQNYINRAGHNAFYDSTNNRKKCCYIRKVEPLARALTGHDAWITGLRWQQSASRARLQMQEWCEEYNLQKINPILDWQDEDIWAYVKFHQLPSSELYAKGYASIGCEPCTRPITVGEDQRAGRWWWEQSPVKECGLHLKKQAV